jgi:hypothetical protein
MTPVSRTQIDEKIDRLYQLPLTDFTRERNALAKEIGGEGGKRVRELSKPSAAAWAVNQLYWRDRKTYEALVESAQRLRTAHRAVLGGRKADLRQADADHRAAVKAALTVTQRLVSEAGQKISGATQTEILQSLERLPSGEPPGRLTKALSPEGFEALQGMPIRARKLMLVPPPAQRSAPEVPADMPETTERARKDARRALHAARGDEKRKREAVARLEKQVAAAERESAAAKHALQRAEDAERKARAALRDAQEELEQSARALRDAERTAND